MKSVGAILTVCGALAFTSLSANAESDFASKISGVYTTNQKDFVTVKRLTFSKEKDGSIKIEGALVGFPDEVSLGEATPELYFQRNSNADCDELLAKFSSNKFKPFMVIHPSEERGTPAGSQYQVVSYTCYMTDVDRKKIHIAGTLLRAKPIAK